MVLLPFAFILASNLALPAVPSAALPSLVAAEYAFADQTEKEGIRSGFLAALRDDSLVFIPRAVNGMAYYKTQLEMGSKLSWYPTVAEVSTGGDFGYSTGPWAFRTAKDGPVAVNGWFVSLWQRDGNGPWKVRLDIGIPTPDPEGRPVPTALPRAAAALAPVTGGQPTAGAELMDLDRAFAKDAAKNPTAAYQARVDEKVRFYRKGRFPVEGSKSLAVALDPYPVTWEPAEGLIAGSGDLGYTRGTLVRTEPGAKITSNYVRVWKKQGPAWKLVLDLELALPAAK